MLEVMRCCLPDNTVKAGLLKGGTCHGYMNIKGF